MAYFPNGTAAEYLEQQCAGCLVQGPCPVLFTQLEYNYKQHDDGNADLKKALNLLIDKDGNCQMKEQIDAAWSDWMEQNRDYIPPEVGGWVHPCDA